MTASFDVLWDYWFPYHTQAEFDAAVVEWDAREAASTPACYRCGMIVGGHGAWVAAQRGIDVTGHCFVRSDGKPVVIEPRPLLQP